MIRTCKPREFDHESGENPFAWIVDEVDRIRHYNQRYQDLRPAKPQALPADFKSLRGFHRGHPVHLFKCDEPGLQAPSEYSFEVAKARKL